MAQYSFSLSDYHSIERAHLKLDGITVIAGCNGSGKSTISRYIYSFVNYTNDFFRLVDSQLVESLEEKLYYMSRVLQNANLLPPGKLRKFRSLASVIGAEADYGKIASLFKSRVQLFCELVEKSLEENNMPSFGGWVSVSLGLDESISREKLEVFYEDTMSLMRDAIDQADKKKQDCRMEYLIQFIQRGLDYYRDFPIDLEFSENGHDLIHEGRFFIPIGLRNAVYIDTPMALSISMNNENQVGDNKIWNYIMWALTNPLGEMPSSARKIASRIRRIIGGRIELEDDEITDSYDIRYIREADNLNISINDAATGLKTFAYMLRLIENGYLNEHSILLIDEPEAHLHPQWIVEFARILVLLHKEVGTTILLASHNPDMVAAIKSISEAEEITEKVSFYQAVANYDTQRYTYEYLGNDIEGIFKSFNIALDRIKDYGK